MWANSSFNQDALFLQYSGHDCERIEWNSFLQRPFLKPWFYCSRMYVSVTSSTKYTYTQIHIHSAFWSNCHLHRFQEGPHVLSSSQQAGQKFLSWTSCCSTLIFSMLYASLHERHKFSTIFIAHLPWLSQHMQVLFNGLFVKILLFCWQLVRHVVANGLLDLIIF